MTIEEELSLIENGFRWLNRGGAKLFILLKKPSHYLTAEECMYIHHTYGLRVQFLVILLTSHGFEFDKEGFAKLLYEDKEEMKRCVPC